MDAALSTQESSLVERKAQDNPTDSSAQVRGRLLVVEDEELTLRAWKRLLTSVGYEVTSTDNGVEALDLCRRFHFDAVLTDVGMAGIDGIELLKRIHAQDKELPVIVVTGDSDIHTALRAMEHGVFKYLLKPASAEQLVATTHDAVKQGRASRGGQTQSSEDLSTVFDRALQQLYMLYQPIVSWNQRRVVGYETLVRSNEPALGNPGALFKAAHALKGVDRIGRRIRELAPIPLQSRSEQLFINLEPVDLLDEQLLASSSPLLAMADRVVLEITERASMDNVPDVQARVRALRDAGYRIAVDDLGAGYAGLASFALLEPDVAKLDMSIVRDVHLIPTKQKLIASMCTLCHDMGMPIVVEGVECAEERDVLVDLGCDLFQGYFFAKPGKPFPEVRW